MAKMITGGPPDFLKFLPLVSYGFYFTVGVVRVLLYSFITTSHIELPLLVIPVILNSL